jgi:cbb3-type cytochrome oxidase subunit 3
MKLSDVMSHMNLSSYAEIGLLIFFLVFLAICARLFFGSKQAMAAAARLPLSDDLLSGDPLSDNAQLGNAGTVLGNESESCCRD